MIIFYSGYSQPLPECFVPDAPIMLSYYVAVHEHKGKPDRRMRDLLSLKKKQRLAKKKKGYGAPDPKKGKEQ